MRVLIWVAVFFTALGFSGCASLQVDKPAVSSVKKVAVVGFSVVQKQPEGWKISVGGGGDKMGWSPGLVHPSPHALEIYDNARRALERRFKWKVVDAPSLKSNATYSKLFDEKMKGWQSRPPLASGYRAWGAAGVMDPWPIERLSAEERQALATSLGVQSLAVVRVRIELEKGGGLERLIGAGELKPQATTEFTLYARDGSEPIWRDLRAAGAAVEKGTQHVLGITAIDELNTKSVEAAKTSFDELITRYEKGA